jgi:hypothetical protein
VATFVFIFGHLVNYFWPLTKLGLFFSEFGEIFRTIFAFWSKKVANWPLSKNFWPR